MILMMLFQLIIHFTKLNLFFLFEFFWPGGLHLKLLNCDSAVELFNDDFHDYPSNKQKKTLASMSRIEKLPTVQKQMREEGSPASLDCYAPSKLQLE